MLDLKNFVFYYSKTGRFSNDFQTENTRKIIITSECSEVTTGKIQKKYNTNVAKVHDVTG